MILSVYVEQICQKIVEMNIKDVIGSSGKISTKKVDDNAASNDDDSEEVEVGLSFRFSSFFLLGF